jgi:hypothetical protein
MPIDNRGRGAVSLHFARLPVLTGSSSPGSLTVPSGSKAASHVAPEAITPEEAENAAERSYARV